MHSTSVSSVIPLAQVSNSFFRKKKFQKKNTSHRSHNNVKMKMDALITLELTLGKADARWIKSVSQESLDIARAYR